MRSLSPEMRHRITLLSPIIVLALGHLTARIGGALFGVWAWLPLALIYWCMLAFFMVWGKNNETILRWLLPATKGTWGWSMLAIAVSLIPLPILIINWTLLRPIEVWLPWLLFALINPWFEEGYWRGLLLDTTATWKGGFSILYTSSLFALSHPILWGVNSIANRSIAVVISTFVMGVVWALVYQKTRSLRWIVIAHILVDLFNLAIPVFLNLYAPTSF